MRRAFFVTATVIALGCGAPRPVPAVSDATLVRGARVFDGTTFVDADVLVEGARIASVAPHLDAPAGARIVDGTGATLLPGLIDAHTHAGIEEATLAQALVFGVTLEIDLFGPPERIGLLREAEREGRWTGMADLRGAGVLATAPGGHGTEYGIPIPTLTEPSEAGAFVEARLAEGSDYIKIIYGHALPEIPVLALATARALIEAAHAHGRLVLAHVETEQDAIDMVDAHVDGLAHLFDDRAASPELVARMAAQHTFVIATLTTNARGCGGDGTGGALADDPEIASRLGETDLARLRRTRDYDHREPCFEPLAASIRAMHDAGIPILAGTDAINPGTAHGASLHGEIVLLARAGLSSAEALAAATSVPARIFSLDDRGRIAPGLRADLVLVDGDVEHDLHATRRIRLVMKAGHDVPRG